MAAKRNKKTEQASAPGKAKTTRRGENLFFYTSAFLFALLILIGMLGGLFYLIVKNNVNGITERHRSVLKVIPIIKNAVGEDTEDIDGIDYLSSYELKQRYRELLKKHEELSASYEDAQETIQNLQEANRKYLDLFNEYKSKEDKLNKDREKLQEDTEKFQQAVAENNIDAFIEFFEGMDQQLAQEVYEKVLKERELTVKKKELADILSGMEPESAARIISELGSRHMETVVSILASMNKESAAAILEQIEPAMASEIILRLSEMYLGEKEGNLP